jgi:hypothetical protein
MIDTRLNGGGGHHRYTIWQKNKFFLCLHGDKIYNIFYIFLIYFIYYIFYNMAKVNVIENLRKRSVVLYELMAYTVFGQDCRN